MADLAKLVVRMEAQTAKFQRDLDKANQKLSRFEKSTNKAISGVQRSFTRLRQTATGFAAAFGAGFIANKFIQNTKAQQDAIAQLNAALKSTGGVAGRSAEQLIANAAALQKVSTFGDEAIISMQSVLLTFKQIRGVNFDRATQSILDISTRLGTDLKSSAQQVGKALDAPVEGIAALTRVGVKFTDEQKALIKSLVETGQVAKAQEVILVELESQFGGSAKAARDTLGGALASLSNAFNDLFELSAEATGGVVTEVNKLTDTLSDPKIKQSADLLGAAIVRSLSFAVEVAASLVEKVQDLGEGIARVVSGAAIDDVQFFEKQLKRQRAGLEAIRKLQPQNSLTGFFNPDEQKILESITQTLENLNKARRFQAEFGSFTSTTASGGGAEVQPTVVASGVTSEQNKALSKFLQDVESATKSGTSALELQRQGIRENIATLEKFINTYALLSDSQLASAGLTREQIDRAVLALTNLDDELLKTYQNIEEVEVTAKKIGESLSPMTAMYMEMLAEIRSATETELEATERTVREFSLKVAELIRAGIISPEAGQEFIQRFVDQQEKPFSQLEEFGKQAARNIQTAFANFLFDPFSNGLKGMLAGFIDTIRRMVAEAAAAEILTAFFGFLSKQSGFVGSLGGSLLKGLETRASGGPVRSNSAYLVGEKGPELLVGAAGKIVPGTDLGGGGMLTVAPVYNIDARGATQDLVKQLPAILAQQARQTVELARRAINEDISRGALGRA